MAEPNHPILRRPCEYEIVGFSYWKPADETGPFIDLKLRKGAEYRKLRFYQPRDIRISEGFPNSSGLEILDVASRGMEGVEVRVSNFEAHGGCPTFWARDVVEILDAGNSD